MHAVLSTAPHLFKVAPPLPRIRHQLAPSPFIFIFISAAILSPYDWYFFFHNII